jgi:hypothetical protein
MGAIAIVLVVLIAIAIVILSLINNIVLDSTWIDCWVPRG